MAELIVVGFPSDTHRAAQVLNILTDLNEDWVVNLEDAVAVYRDFDGSLVMDGSLRPTTTDGAKWGGSLGLLIGATLAIPFTAGASAAVAAGALAAGALGGAALGASGGAIDATFWKDELGIPPAFVQEVSSLVQAGDSAIYAILDSDHSELVVSRFQGYGGKILRTTLSADQQARAEAVLNSRTS